MFVLLAFLQTFRNFLIEKTYVKNMSTISPNIPVLDAMSGVCAGSQIARRRQALPNIE